MAVRTVVQLPEPVLSRLARSAAGLGNTERRALAENLVDTMRASPACVGLAANQIGVELRAFVVDITGHRKARSCHGLIVLFDPEVQIVHGSVIAREGCMSVPSLTGDVARGSEVVVRGTDEDGAVRVIRADAFEARAILHEIDHLDGLVFLDRLVSADALFHRKVYR